MRTTADQIQHSQWKGVSSQHKPVQDYSNRKESNERAGQIVSLTTNKWGAVDAGVRRNTQRVVRSVAKILRRRTQIKTKMAKGSYGPNQPNTPRWRG